MFNSKISRPATPVHTPERLDSDRMSGWARSSHSPLPGDHVVAALNCQCRVCRQTLAPLASSPAPLARNGRRYAKRSQRRIGLVVAVCALAPLLVATVAHAWIDRLATLRTSPQTLNAASPTGQAPGLAGARAAAASQVSQPLTATTANASTGIEVGGRQGSFRP